MRGEVRQLQMAVKKENRGRPGAHGGYTQQVAFALAENKLKDRTGSYGISLDHPLQYSILLGCVMKVAEEMRLDRYPYI